MVQLLSIVHRRRLTVLIMVSAFKLQMYLMVCVQTLIPLKYRMQMAVLKRGLLFWDNHNHWFRELFRKTVWLSVTMGMELYLPVLLVEHSPTILFGIQGT